MYKRMVVGLLLALAPSAVFAQGMQENYLPSKSQLYFRFDGMKKHQADYEKTAVGKMMQGETGVFLSELWKYAQEQLQNATQNEPKVGPLLKDFTKLIGTMHENGVVLGVGVEKINPPEVQAVLVFPQAAGESGTLIPLIQRIAEGTRANVKNTRVANRFINTVQVEFLQVGWWAQGPDAILFLGTTDPVEFAKAIDANKTGIAKNAVYKKIAGFKEFKTISRGYFDMTSVLDVANDIAPQAGQVIDQLGLRGIKTLTFASGFDGINERSVVDIDMPGPRKGLLSLTSQKKISLKVLPVMPNDITGFSASSINLNKSYDVLTGVVDGVVRVFDANTADDIKDGIKAFEGAIGVDINKDLFSNFGDVMVTYSSPSDGFLGTGAVVAIQAKDPKKIGDAIDKLIKAIPANPAGEVTIKKKAYHGGEIIQLQLSGQANSQLATFGIYKNWFIYAQLPQPIKGFILRQEGKLPAWKASPELTKALKQFPAEFNSISVTDPRPLVQTLVSITPFALNILNAVGGQAIPGFRPFDIELVPNAQEVTRHLFPNVTVGIDNGKRIRTETRGSLLLPF